MKEFYPFKTIAVLILSLSFASAQSWTSIATDATGDETTGLDGTEAHYYYDAASDSIWFKIDVSGINSSQQGDFGINVMVNIPGASNSFKFWGAQNDSAGYHKLVTVWVTGTPPSSYTGTIGVADGSGVSMGNYTNLHSDNISINMDVNNNHIILGMRRKDLVTDAEMGGNSITMKTAAATGTSSSWGDDIYDASATMTITTSSVGQREFGEDELVIYPLPANNQLTIGGLNPGTAISLVNTAGQICLRAQAEASVEILDLNKLRSGLYVLNIKQNGVNHLRKVSIE